MKDKFIIDNEIFCNIDDRKIQIELLRSKIITHTINFFSEKSFLYIDPPIIHEYIAGKKGEISIQIDDGIFALNSSNALYLSAYACIFKNVFSISPTFRKENEFSNHLTEFKMLEVEALHISFEGIISLLSEYMQYILQTVSCDDTSTFYSERAKSLSDKFKTDFYTYIDFIDILKSESIIINEGDDLSYFDVEISKILQNPTFIIDYPFPLASWTALPKFKNIAYAFNLILPDAYGELAEGCQRNVDHRVFEYKFSATGIKSLNWYVDAIKSCNDVRSGFGLGVERLIRWIIGCPNIADTALFPRFAEKR